MASSGGMDLPLLVVHSNVPLQELPARAASANCPCTSRPPQAAGLDGVHWRRRHGEGYIGKRKELIEALRAAGMPLV